MMKTMLGRVWPAREPWTQPSRSLSTRFPTGILNTAGGDELTQSQFPFYGSYDGTTNDPVVYPNGTSIANLANEVLVQITPAALPDGTNGVAYPPTGFSISGGAFTAPYTWTAPNAGLPPGLTLSSTGSDFRHADAGRHL